MQRKCKNCGEEILDDENLFCPKCGKYLEIVPAKKEYPIRWFALAAVIIILVIVAGAFIAKSSSKLDTSLTMTSDSNLGSSNEFCVELKDVNDNPLASKFIKVEVNSTQYTLKTDDNGTAKINLTLGDGSHEIKTYFKGDEKYAECDSSDIVVK